QSRIPFPVVLDVSRVIGRTEVEGCEPSVALARSDSSQQEVLETVQVLESRRIGRCTCAKRDASASGKVVEAVKPVVASFRAEAERVTAVGPRQIVADDVSVEFPAAVVIDTGADREG